MSALFEVMKPATKIPTVLLTRPAHQAEPVKTELEALGYRVLIQSAIDILPPDDWCETDDALQNIRLGQFDWLIFSSSNGIHAFFDRVGERAAEWVEVWADLQIAVAGGGTNSALYSRIGRYANVVPDTFTAEAVAQALSAEAAQGKRFLHLRASRGRDVLKRLLTESGGSVTEIAVYKSVDCPHADPQILELLRSGGIDYVTVTSSAIAGSLVKMFGDLLRRTSLVSISPLTSATLRSLGFSPQWEASEASLAGIVAVLANGKGERKHGDPSTAGAMSARDD